MKIIKGTLLLAMASSLIACNNEKKDKTDMKKKTEENYTITTKWMDTTTSPQQDFYQFANGHWLANTEIPSTESRWGSFSILIKENKERLTKILNKAVDSTGEKGGNYQLIGDFYSSMKNMDQRNQQSSDNIKNIKIEITNINGKEDIPAAIHQMNEKGITAFYDLYVGQDLKNTDKNVLYFSQGGLGLPNRNYYYDSSKQEIRNQYKEYIARDFKLFGYDNPKKRAEDAYKIEKALAKTMMKPVELRIPKDSYHPTSIEETALYKNFVDIPSFIDEFGTDSTKMIIVGQPKHFTNVVEIVANTDFETLQNYLAWRYIQHYDNALGKDLLQSHFDFYSGALSGIEDMKPVNERAVEAMTRNPIKVALGQEFVKRYFSVEAKKKVNDLVDNLFTVFENRIKNLDWMGDSTKKMALYKLHAIGRKLGYPEVWRSLEGLNIIPDDFLANSNALDHFSYVYNLSKLSKPVNPDQWSMPAQMVNAYYHPLFNEIVFPAGIMQPPFFDVNAEDAVNYATIGMVIGHELTHGFDDMGSKFAADGTLDDWWTEEDRDNFEKKTKKLGATYDQFCPFDGLCVNGDLTMGENIADLGGIALSFHAYQLTEEYKNGEKRKGFTPAQRFFIAYAQLWKTIYEPKELKKRLATDPHSPAKYRVNGPLMNSPAFFQAFNVQKGDAMRKGEKEIARIW